MANWYYYNKNDEKIGPLSAMVLKELAIQGLITKETKVENSNGRTALAGSVNGLTFAEAEQPEAAVYGFEDGLNFPALTSEGPTLTDFDPFANSTPLVQQPAPSKLPVTLKKPIVFLPLGCLGLGFVMFVIGGIASAIIGPEENSAENVEQATALGLMNAYNANKVVADRIYKGKTLIVNGTIENIGKDIRDLPYVALKTRDKGPTIYCVQCFFSKKDEGALFSLRKGQSISIKGKCDGALGNVFIKNCSIVNDE